MMRLLFPNLAYLADLSSPAGGWQAGDLSIDALHDPVLGHVARSTGLDPKKTRVSFALDRPRQVGGLVVLGHNLSTGARLIVQGAHDAAFTDIVFNPGAEPVEVYPRLFRTRDLAWSHPNWFSGKPLVEDLGITTTAAFCLFGRNWTARFWRVVFDDPSNGDGFVDVGKVFLGPAFDPPHNYMFGAALSVQDESRMTQSLGGTRFFDRRGKRRRMEFAFDMLRERREFSRWFDMTARLGITDEVMVIPDPDDIRNLQRRSFCAHLREPTPLEQAFHKHMSASLVAEELI
ncbi:hypothetical protein [Aureimonas sp. SK2]|uniref:hypothetical protein n=1 Tax=Aureimonas sp. SK2 TaxID=3015992 RepID=UPI0024446753|nr:hypothetical protein [Aureimonas sp. SK2]